VLLNYHIGRFVLGSLCVGDLVRLGLSSFLVINACNQGKTLCSPCIAVRTRGTDSGGKFILNLIKG